MVRWNTSANTVGMVSQAETTSSCASRSRFEATTAVRLFASTESQTWKISARHARRMLTTRHSSEPTTASADSVTSGSTATYILQKSLVMEKVKSKRAAANWAY